MKQTLIASAAVASLLASTVALAPRASGRSEEKLPAGSYRATVEGIAKGGDVLVSRIEVEVRPGSMVQVVCDRPLQGGASCRAGEPKGPDRATSIVIVTVLGDFINFGGKDVRKFRVGVSCAGGSAVFSDTGPAAAPGKLDDLLSITLKAGTYREGELVPAIRFEGKTYSLVVDAPKP